MTQHTERPTRDATDLVERLRERGAAHFTETDFERVRTISSDGRVVAHEVVCDHSVAQRLTRARIQTVVLLDGGDLGVDTVALEVPTTPLRGTTL